MRGYYRVLTDSAGVVSQHHTPAGAIRAARRLSKQGQAGRIEILSAYDHRWQTQERFGPGVLCAWCRDRASSGMGGCHCI